MRTSKFRSSCSSAKDSILFHTFYKPLHNSISFSTLTRLAFQFRPVFYVVSGLHFFCLLLKINIDKCNKNCQKWQE